RQVCESFVEAVGFEPLLHGWFDLGCPLSGRSSRRLGRRLGMRSEQTLQLTQIGSEARVRATALHFALEHGPRSVSQPQQGAHHATEYFMVRFAHERLLKR